MIVFMINNTAQLLSAKFEPIICRLNIASAAQLAEIDLGCNRPPWSEKLFNDEFKNPHALIYGARVHGELVGYLDLHLVLDEAHIVNFGVRFAYRGLGVGRSLLLSVLRDLEHKAARWVTLEARASNSVAKRLYESLGFFEVGTREKYYSDDLEDATVMGLNLRQFIDNFGRE